LSPGDRVALGKKMTVEAFRTDHVVPSLGYHLLRRKQHLAPAFQGLSRQELATARAAGTALTEAEDEALLTYVGDTGPEVFATEPRLFTSRVLMLELTFLGEKLRDRGRLYRHLHFEDLVAHAPRFENEALVLYHLSRRHRPGELRRLVAERLPELAPRTHVLADGE